MTANLKKNKISILAIFLFSLPVLRVFKGIKKSRINHCRKEGFYLNFQQAAFSFSGIRFKRLYLRTTKYSLTASNFTLEISPGSVLSGKWKRAINRIDGAKVSLIFHKQERYREGRLTSSLKSADLFKWEYRYYPVFKRILASIFAVRQFSANIGEICAVLPVGKHYITVKAENPVFQHNVITSSVSLTYQGLFFFTSFNAGSDTNCNSIILSQTARSYLLNNGKAIAAAEFYRLQFSCRNATNFEIKGNLKDIFFEPGEGSGRQPPPAYLNFEIPIIFDKDKFSISNESNMDFNGIQSSFELYHNCKEADLVKGSLLFSADGENFFSAYPFFITEWLKNFNAKGCVTLKLDYMTTLSDFSNYYFKATTIENTFELTDIRNNHFLFLNNDFTHTVKTDDGNALRIIDLNPAQSNFICYQDIPKILTDVIVLTEDPHYSNHNGIDPYFVGVAIAKNMASRSFVKGASTITMQMVRNLFLYHAKTISRKLEELLIAWLVENHFKISKERILEIYLNIIEFGDNVYGICEAAEYYFGKKVKDLDITECLVLSYIIPRPKFFLEAVRIQSPKLIRNLRKHIEFYSKALLERRCIDEGIFRAVSYIIHFRPEIGTITL